MQEAGRRKLVRNLAVGALVSGLAVGLAASPGKAAPGDDIDLIVNPLLGGHTYDGCADDEVVQLHNAIGILLNAVTSGFNDLQTCLVNAALVENSCRDGNFISSQLRRSDIAHISCRDLLKTDTFVVNGEAPVQIDGERLTLDHDFIRNSGPTRIAGVIAHELMHNRGFRHEANDFGSTFYPNTVPEQAEACIVDGRPNPWQGAGPQPPQCPPRETGCEVDCQDDRDACMADGDVLPRVCVAEFRGCISRCR